MLGQTDYDVYIVILYITSQLFKEKNGLASFKMNMSFLVPQIKKEIQNRKIRFESGIEYPNGFVKKSAWNELERFNHMCKEKYGLELF